jgi:hypothetical protein
MTERFCDCGNKLSSINRSLKCYQCKEKAEYEKRREADEKILAEAKARGLVRLHSCISSLHDPMPKRCTCRKFITFDEARAFIKSGRAVDFQTRKACFCENAIVEASRHKNVPRSTIGARVAIERKIVQPIYDERDIARMRATAEEDRRLRREEQACKADIEHALATEAQAKLIVFVDEAVFDEAKKRSWGRPEIFVTHEERTSIGRDVGSVIEEPEPIDEAEVIETDETDENEEQNDQTIATEADADENAESAPADTESVEELAEAENENLAEAA